MWAMPLLEISSWWPSKNMEQRSQDWCRRFGHRGFLVLAMEPQLNRSMQGSCLQLPTISSNHLKCWRGLWSRFILRRKPHQRSKNMSKHVSSAYLPSVIAHRYPFTIFSTQWRTFRTVTAVHILQRQADLSYIPEMWQVSRKNCRFLDSCYHFLSHTSPWARYAVQIWSAQFRKSVLHFGGLCCTVWQARVDGLRQCERRGPLLDGGPNQQLPFRFSRRMAVE